MTTKPTLTIAITPEQFSAKEVELETNGITITGDDGDIKKSGVDVEYSYDGIATLTIIVEGKPFFISESNLEKKIQEWFAT